MREREIALAEQCDAIVFETLTAADTLAATLPECSPTLNAHSQQYLKVLADGRRRIWHEACDAQPTTDTIVFGAMSRILSPESIYAERPRLEQSEAREQRTTGLSGLNALLRPDEPALAIYRSLGGSEEKEVTYYCLGVPAARGFGITVSEKYHDADVRLMVGDNRFMPFNTMSRLWTDFAYNQEFSRFITVFSGAERVQMGIRTELSVLLGKLAWDAAHPPRGGLHELQLSHRLTLEDLVSCVQASGNRLEQYIAPSAIEHVDQELSGLTEQVYNRAVVEVLTP